jgi:uncharacterized protein YkwD
MSSCRQHGALPPWTCSLVAASTLGCLVQGTGSKTVDAVASAAMAGGAVAAQEIARERTARASASGAERSAGCPSWECYADADMTLEEARRYALAYIDHTRADQGAAPLTLDYALNTLAQDGSRRLARDHRPHQHPVNDPQACPNCAEMQGSPDGIDVGPVHDQLQAGLGLLLSEGSGGPNPGVLLSPRWHRLGVGVVNPDGRMYLTIDLAP